MDVKRFLFIIVLCCITFVAYGQREKDLPLRPTSSPGDTVRVLQNGSSIMLRSVLQGAIYDSLATHTDTLQALRADIDAGGSSLLLDSINQHRIELDNHTDSINAHRTELDNHTDSIAAHRLELNNAVDSITDHRTEINANTSTGWNNAVNISSNSVFIGVNTTDIASLEDSISKHTDTLQAHQDQIAALFDTTALHLDSLQLHRTQIGALFDTAAVHLDTLQLHQSQIAAFDDTNYWTRTGVDLTPTTAGDDILLGSGDFIKFGSTATNIYGATSSMIITVNSSNRLVFSTNLLASLTGFSPYTSKSLNLGSGSRYWHYLYTDTVYVSDGTTLIGKDGSNNLFLTDAVTGSKTLAELAAAGTSYTFADGLTETAGTVDLGGTTADPILISSTGSDNIELRTGNGTDYSWMRVESGNTVVIGTYDQGTGNVSTIELDHSDMGISDEINSKGLTYSLDYSANFTDRSLVDKEYVDNTIPIYGTITTQTGSTYTLDIDDAQTLVISDIDGGSAFTVPPNSSVAYPIGTRIRVSKIGTTGNCNINEGSGVTINNWNSAPAVRLMGTGEIIKIDTDEWMVTGDIIQDA